MSARVNGRPQGLEKRQVESDSKARRVLLDCRSSADSQIFQQPKRQLCREAGVSCTSSVGQRAVSSPKILLPGLICAVETLLSPVLHLGPPWVLDSPPGVQTPKGCALLCLKSSSSPSLGDLPYGSDFTGKNPFLILSSCFQYHFNIIICR